MVWKNLNAIKLFHFFTLYILEYTCFNEDLQFEISRRYFIKNIKITYFESTYNKIKGKQF